MTRFGREQAFAVDTHHRCAEGHHLVLRNVQIDERPFPPGTMVVDDRSHGITARPTWIRLSL